MKKPNKHTINLQILENIKKRKGSVSFKNRQQNFSYTTFCLTEKVDLNNKLHRHSTIKAINAIELFSGSNRPYLDFSKVKVLTPMATIYLKHVLDKYLKVPCKGKPSLNHVVSGMLTKLSIYSRLGIKEAFSDHDLVERWYTFSGENADFGDEYDEIENVLKEKFGENSETFDVINTAIGEAVINVVNHAYDRSDAYKKWYLFLSIKPDRCNVVISDLGQTIPNSIPTKITDNMLERIFNIQSWGSLNDDSKIEIATQYQKTATNLPNRGKGFQDMKAVCNEVQGSTMLVHSRKGFWAKGNFEPEMLKKQNYKSTVNGTIISWFIPLDNSSIKVKGTI